MGYGILPVDMNAAQAIFDTYDEWNLEKLPVETVHDMLDLPPDFRVKHIGVDYYRRLYLVMLEAPQLPDVPPGHMIPQVLPIMTMDNGKVRIQELRTEIPTGAPCW